MRGIALTAVLLPEDESRAGSGTVRSPPRPFSRRVVVAEEDILQTRRGKEKVDDVVAAGQEAEQGGHAAFERDHDPAAVTLQHLDP